MKLIFLNMNNVHTMNNHQRSSNEEVKLANEITRMCFPQIIWIEKSNEPISELQIESQIEH